MRVPDLLVEQLALGELDAARAAQVRDALSREEGGLARLEALETSSARILAAHPPARVAREVLRRLGRSPAERTSRTWAIAAMATVGAAMVALVVLPLRGPDDDTRIKGLTPSLHVYRQRAGGELERVRAGATARPGDLIQLSIVAPRTHAAVVSLDGAGAVTAHFPDGSRAAPVGDGEHPLPRAFELDAAPGFERFVLVTGDRPFDVADVIAAARAVAAAPGSVERPLSLPAGLDQTSFVLLKESR